MQSWYSIWPLDGFNYTRVITDGMELTEVLRTVGKAESHLLEILWNLANLVKNYNGIIAHQMVLLREQYVESKVERLLCFWNLAWMKKWWAESVDCCCFLRKVQDLLADEKTLYENRFGEPCKGPAIPFGSMVPSIWKESSARNLPRICIGRGCIWIADIMVAGVEELQNLGASEIRARRVNAKEVLMSKTVKIPDRRWNRQSCMKGVRVSENKSTRTGLNRETRLWMKPMPTLGRSR